MALALTQVASVHTAEWSKVCLINSKQAKMKANESSIYIDIKKSGRGKQYDVAVGVSVEQILLICFILQKSMGCVPLQFIMIIHLIHLLLRKISN